MSEHSHEEDCFAILWEGFWSDVGSSHEVGKVKGMDQDDGLAKMGVKKSRFPRPP